jgi:hypothetical protein
MLISSFFAEPPDPEAAWLKGMSISVVSTVSNARSPIHNVDFSRKFASWAVYKRGFGGAQGADGAEFMGKMRG